MAQNEFHHRSVPATYAEGKGGVHFTPREFQLLSAAVVPSDGVVSFSRLRSNVETHRGVT